MIKVLELFSGTGSVGKVCSELGWETLSLDLEMKADINIDLMEWDYKKYPKDSFDVIWASPPCTYYSKLQYCWIGRKKKNGIITTHETIEEQRKESDKLIERTFEIIEYFNPHYWFLENPLSCLKDRDVMKDKPYYIVDYCKYCDWGYRKRTCIWTNKKDFKPLTCHNDCENMVFVEGQKIHKERMGTTKTIIDNGKIIRVNTAELRKKYKDYPNLQKQHKKVLANGYEIIDGKKVLCNTKEKREKLRHRKTADGGYDKRNGIIKTSNGTDKLERYRIPPNLIYSLFQE